METECTRCGEKFVGEEVIKSYIREIDMGDQGIFEVCIDCLTPKEKEKYELSSVLKEI